MGLDDYDRDHNSDTVVKKATKVSRVIDTSRYDVFSDPNLGGSEKAAKKYVDDVLSKDNSYERKYVSIDGVKNSGRSNGKEYYLSWFTEFGLEPDNTQVATYELKKDIRVASGKQVVDALIEEVGSRTLTELLKNNKTISSLTLDYTRNQELFNKINKRFIDEGYDAIEDINDLDTDMPVIMFNSSKSLGKPTAIQTGRKINTNTQTIVRDSPLMGKNSIRTRLALLLTLAQRCTRFRRRSLHWMISVVNI